MIFSTGHSKIPPAIRSKYRMRSAGLVAFVLTLVAGCSPPPPTTSQAHLSVGMPDGDGDELADVPIEPPYLSDLEKTSAQAVAMRVGEDSQSARSKEKSEAASAVDTGAPADFPEGVDGPEDYRTWPAPDLALVVTGQQHGYIEPCGCTGLDRQKGGVARRFTFMRQLREMGWTLVPLDAGDQIRRYGRQAEIKLQQTVKALKAMDYQGIGFGPNDVRLGVGELLAVAAGETADDTMFASANVELFDPSMMPQSRVVERKGRKVGITSVLDPDSLEGPPNPEIPVHPMIESTRKALAALSAENADFKVLLFFGKEENGKKLVRDVQGFDLIVAAGGYGEPTYRAEPIEGTKTKMVVTGNKGMYAGLVGIYSDQPIKYARVPLTHEFEDAPEMRQLMQEYQDQLKSIGLQGLGLLPPIPHSSGQKFVGTAKCGECHTSALEVWEATPHAEATDHIVKPPKERGDIARHFDPECISCHVTGWNPQEFYPYASGYLSLQQSEHLTGNGCENCHGPGSDHAAAEADGSTVAAELRDQLRNSMKLPLEKAREKCMACHDLDNSPDFHEDDAFEDIYWPEVEHYGLD